MHCLQLGRAPNPAIILAGAGLPIKGRLPDLPEPEPKSGTSLVNNLYIVTVFCAWEIVHATWQMFIWLGLWLLIFEVSLVTSTQRVEPVSVSLHTSVCPSQRIWYVDRHRWVIQDDMPYEFVPIQSQSPQVEKMADFKVCLLHQYACNQNTNGELWYSKIISKFLLDRFLIFIHVWRHVTFILYKDESTSCAICGLFIIWLDLWL